MGKYSDAILSQPAESAPQPTRTGKYSSRVLEGERMGLQGVTPYQQQMLDAGTTRTTGGTFDTPTGRSPYAEDQKPVEGRGLGLGANFRAGLVDDPDTKLRLLAEARFPNDPKAVERFGWRDGNPVFINEQGQLERADTGRASTAGDVAASLPEAVGGLLGSFLPMPIVGSVLGSTTGNAVKQIGANLLLDEPQTPGGNALGFGGELLVSGVGGAGGKLISKMANRAAIQGAERFDPAVAKATMDRIEQSTGIRLDTAQVANVRGLADLKKWASKYPSDAQEVIAALDRQQGDQVADAIEKRLLAQISSKTDTAEMATSGINGAKQTIKLAEMKRDRMAAPLYRKAYTEEIPGADVADFMQDPVLSAAYKSVMSTPTYKRELTGTSANSIMVWDYVKRNIDDQIAKAQRNGARNQVRMLTNAKEDLVSKMDLASADYAAARSTYADATKDFVDPLKNGWVGVLAKVNGHDLTDKVSKIMSGDILAAPGIASDVRGALAASGQDAVWNDLVKLSLFKSFNNAAKETQAGDVVNLAGKFRQSVIGTPQQKLAMDVALGRGGAHQQFGDIMDALGMIAKETRNRGGSDTAFNQAISRQQAGSAPGELLKAVTAPGQAVREHIDNKFLQQNAKALADALTDPDKVARLKELRKLKPSTERAVAMLSVVGIGSYGLGSAADAVTSPPDADPQALPSQPQAGQ